MSGPADSGVEWDGMGGQWTLVDRDNDKAWLTSDVMVQLDDCA